MAVRRQVFHRHGFLHLVQQPLHLSRSPDTDRVAQADFMAAHFHEFGREIGNNRRVHLAFKGAAQDTRDVAADRHIALLGQFHEILETLQTLADGAVGVFPRESLGGRRENRWERNDEQFVRSRSKSTRIVTRLNQKPNSPTSKCFLPSCIFSAAFKAPSRPFVLGVRTESVTCGSTLTPASTSAASAILQSGMRGQLLLSRSIHHRICPNQPEEPIWERQSWWPR